MAIEDIYTALDSLEDIDTTAIKEMVTSEFGLVSDGAAAKIDDLNAQVNKLTAELNEVKAKNFDLMIAATSEVEKPQEEEPAEAPDLDDLFKED